MQREGKRDNLLKNQQKTKFDEIYLDQFIENSYKKIGLKTKKEFKDYLKKNLSYEDIKNKISYEIAWNRLIYLKYNSN